MYANMESANYHKSDYLDEESPEKCSSCMMFLLTTSVKSSLESRL